jgi:hypothetical protein
VVDADPGERIGGACDDAIWFFGERSRQFLSPSPVAVGRERATFRVECPSDDLSKGEPLAGRGSLTLSTPAGRRLGRGTFADAGGFGRFRVRVALTRLGRRLAARQGGTRASVALRGPGIPPRTWTIALRVG